MCYNCGNNSCNSCNTCQQQTCDCPVQLDFNCIFYHKNGSAITELDGLNLPNGVSLTTVIEVIDEQIKQLVVTGWTLPYLTGIPYTINTLQQFGQSVDTELADLQDQITTLSASASTPNVKIDSNSVAITLSGTLNHTIKADVRISALTDNQATIQADGLMVAPQTLAISVVDKTLTISDGNTVSLASLASGVDGYLGSFTSDPAAANGQYWFRSDLAIANSLRIQLPGGVRTIPTT